MQAEVRTVFVVEPVELMNFFNYLTEQTNENKRAFIGKEINEFLQHKVTTAETDE